MFDIDTVRQAFKAISQSDIVYLDNAATTHKPSVVLDAVRDYYEKQNANVHRGSHQLTASATRQFEDARQCVADFIGARSSREIIWTRGATEAVNLIAQTYARSTLQAGDEILVGEMEHHANIIPWQIVAQQTGAKVVKIPMKPDCTLDMDAYRHLLSARTKIVAVAHITNVTGTRNPVEEMIEQAHPIGAVVVIDGAQGIVHEKVNVQQLDADFYLFSGHKLYAPTGIGALYGKEDLLNSMPVWHGGGKMVEKVTFEHTTYADLPGKFEAGTPNIGGAVALAKAIEWLSTYSAQETEAHIHHLQEKAYQQLSQIDGVSVIGYQKNSSIISFIVKGIHHQDIATLLDQQGIAVRSGHHCAHPLMDALDIEGTIRVSIGLYNNEADIDKFIQAVKNAIELLD